MAVDTSALDGYFKDVFGDLSDAVPEFEIVAGMVPFKKRAKQGEKYSFPVRLRRGHGHTVNNDGSAFTLGAVASGLTKEATVTGMEYVGRESVSYAAASRGTSSKEAFGDVFGETVTDMKDTASFFRELCLLYGGSDGAMGALASDPGTGPGARDMTITPATWAPGLWVQAEGMPVDIFSSDLGTQRTNSGTRATIGSVDVENRTVEIQLGDESDLDDITTGDVIFPEGAYSSGHVWFSGLFAIAENTGTLFGISAATYGQWSASSSSAGSSRLTMAKITNAAAKAAIKCGMRPLKCLVSTYTWSDLNNDLAAIRRDARNGGGNIELGHTGITYYGPNGRVEICPHPMVKAGEALIFDPSTVHRIGSSDISFELPGSSPNQQKFFQELSGSAGYELRSWFDQAIINTKPASMVKITNIVNTEGN